MPATAEEKEAIHKLETQIAVIAAHLSDLRKIGWGLGFWALGMLMSALYVAYQAGQIHNEVGALRRDFAEMGRDLTAMQSRIAHIETGIVGLTGDVKAQFQALDRIEKALAQNQPAKHPQ